MWAVNEETSELRMTEEDFGIELPMELKGFTVTASDEFRIKIKDRINGTVLITEVFSNVQNQTIKFVISEEDSAKLPPGNYVYSLDWYQDGNFNYCLIESAILRVGDKA